MVTPTRLEAGPIDASLGDHRAFGRLATRWAGLTILMVAMVPVLLVVGLVLLHLFFRAG